MSFRQNNRTIKNLPSFRYGMNTQKEAGEIDDMELADCENFTVEEDTIKSAQGYVQWDSVSNAGPYFGVQGFRFSNGNQVTVRQRQGVLEYTVDAEGDVWATCTLPTTGSPASTLVLDQTLCTFAMLNDIILWSNGVQYPMSSTDGINWTYQTSLPKSKIVFNNGANRIIYAGQTEPSKIQWSDINTPLTINALSYQYIDPNNSEEIVGVGKTPQGTNIVFKRNSFYEISDYTTDGALDVNFIGTAQCASHHSICTTENSIIWAGWGYSAYELIGGQIRNITGSISPIGRNEAQKLNKFCATYYNGKYHLSMPDADISAEYNSQEYIFHKNMARPDAVQPYVITRNRRYFGCYGQEDFEFSYGREITCYAGDSRPSTMGSPAVVNDLFCFINDFRDSSFPQGLNGEAQECFLVTKFFTDNIPYYSKKFKKLFLTMLLENQTTLTLSYRFLPFGTWYDVNKTYDTEELNFILEDGNEGGFSEGFGFFSATQADDFIDIENSDRPRGIQFKISSNQINDITILGLAYQFVVKPKFR